MVFLKKKRTFARLKPCEGPSFFYHPMRDSATIRRMSQFFHIYNRGANREKIFSNEGNYRFLLNRIQRYLPDYEIALAAYCLMPNHYLFLIREDCAGDKSRFIQRLFNSYTQAYNLQNRRKGTLFESRMRAKEVADEYYALQLIRYIHLNPVRAGIVCAPGEWTFSSHTEWLDTCKRNICDTQLRRRFFQNSADYAGFIAPD